MRIIVVGGAGAVGRAAVAALSGRHEIVVAGRSSGSVRVDIRSADSVRAMYREVGRFDALVCAAGDAHLGPFDAMSEAEFGVGIESKLLGQVRLVLLGRALIAEGGSFTLMSGYIFDDPIRGSASYAAANGGVEGFVRAAALDLGRGVRINAVSPAWPRRRPTSSAASTPVACRSRCARSAQLSRAASTAGAPARSSARGVEPRPGAASRPEPPTPPRELLDRLASQGRAYGYGQCRRQAELARLRAR